MELVCIPVVYTYFLLCRVWQEKEENKALQVLQGFRYVHSFLFKKKINSHVFINLNSGNSIK